MFKRYTLMTILCTTLFMNACQFAKTVIPIDKRPAPVTIVPQTQGQILMSGAAKAWDINNMMEAERLYNLAVQDPSLNSAESILAWERLVKAALVNKHPHSALDALDRWRRKTPGIDAGQIWMQSWLQAVAALQPGEAARQAEQIWKDNSRPATLRFTLLMPQLASIDVATFASLGQMYQQSAPAEKAQMEQQLLAGLVSLTDQHLLFFNTPPQDERKFPYSILLVETARRTANSDPILFQDLIKRIGVINFADPNIKAFLSSPSTPTDPTQTIPVSELPLPNINELISGSVSFNNVCTALVLPISGPYSSIGKSVSTGASTAKNQLAKAGVRIELYIIDTENPDWLKQVAGLPAQCIAIGGPLRHDSFKQAKDSNLTTQRAFFTFLSRLEDEGRSGWRFFSSREDQFQTMLNFGRDLGITSYGSLYSDDDYGKTVLNEFSAAASASGAQLNSAMAYNPEDPKSLTRVAGDFVNVRIVNKVPIPSTSFSAVFLPDSWKNMDMLISSIFYQGEDTQVLMGTSLWEQSLLDSPPRVLNNLDLVVFPGVLNKRSLSAPTRLMLSELPDEQANTWAALGYDFVRFASAINLNSPDPMQVNSRLDSAQNITWAMAPIHWKNGMASQKLFVLRPSTDAPALVDVASFRTKLDNIKARSQRRAANAQRRGGK